VGYTVFDSVNFPHWFRNLGFVAWRQQHATLGLTTSRGSDAPCGTRRDRYVCRPTHDPDTTTEPPYPTVVWSKSESGCYVYARQMASTTPPRSVDGHRWTFSPHGITTRAAHRPPRASCPLPFSRRMSSPRTFAGLPTGDRVPRSRTTGVHWASCLLVGNRGSVAI